MIQDVLLNLVYLYYPKDVCPWEHNETYLQTLEYRKLQSTIDFFNSDVNQKIRNIIKTEFESDSTLKNLEDFSNLDSQDRCFKFFLNVFEKGELYSITLYLSILIPYYIIETRKHIAEPFFTKSKIEELERENLDTRSLKDLILDIESIVEYKLLYRKIPPTITHLIIDNVSFGDIRLGNFKIYNAFFNNEHINKHDNCN